MATATGYTQDELRDPSVASYTDNYGYGVGGSSTKRTMTQNPLSSLIGQYGANAPDVFTETTSNPKVVSTTGTQTEWGVVPNAPLPAFAAPTVNQGRIEALASREASAPTAELRMMTREALSKAAGASDNPYAIRNITRDALGKFGVGISSIQNQAYKTGLEQYMGTEFTPQMQAAQMNFQAAMAKWNAMIGKTTTSTGRQVQNATDVFQRQGVSQF